MPVQQQRKPEYESNKADLTDTGQEEVFGRARTDTHSVYEYSDFKKVERV